MSSDLKFDIEEIEKKPRLGFYVALIGTLMIFVAGLVGIIDYAPFISFGFIFILPSLITLIWGTFGLVGCFQIYLDDIKGNYILFFIGAMSLIGMFIPILIYEDLVIYLSNSFAYVDPFFILIGAIIDFLYKKEMI
ncbi:MAG: hypothetical protein GF317_16375 [Candidatus Lokiarchaeota archaeon]|nr:hypothetical protein [Candidatus Lokiarchaeota archaeon]MBD3201111.1 hypothetical protein [Candidatus Lokiarchaeota archaeon]